jgi:hypothetical protein
MRARTGLASDPPTVLVGRMDKSKEAPVMQAFPDKGGAGWHVIIRYHQGHERRIDGFSSEDEAMEWIVANSHELDT